MDSRRKRLVRDESRGASFDQLFSRSSSTAEVSKQQQAVLRQQAAEEVATNADGGFVLSVADSDGESDAPGSAPLPSGDAESAAPANPKRKRSAEKKKAKPATKRSAASPSQPKRAVRLKVASYSGQDVD